MTPGALPDVSPQRWRRRADALSLRRGYGADARFAATPITVIAFSRCTFCRSFIPRSTLRDDAAAMPYARRHVYRLRHNARLFFLPLRLFSVTYAVLSHAAIAGLTFIDVYYAVRRVTLSRLEHSSDISIVDGEVCDIRFHASSRHNIVYTPAAFAASLYARQIAAIRTLITGYDARLEAASHDAILRHLLCRHRKAMYVYITLQEIHFATPGFVTVCFLGADNRIYDSCAHQRRRQAAAR